MPFTHLHVHTHYSLLDGACKIPELVKRAKALGMDSLAITDHGCMFGVIEFFNECKKEGIKPILGLEAYMAPTSRLERKDINGEAAYHLLLLAKDMEGYKNLLKLSSASYIDGFYRKPRIDKDILREHSKGLIATSACLGGEVPGALMKRDAKAAREIAETYAKIFEPDQFFIEIQRQGIKEQDDVNPELVEIAKRLGVGVVGTNDVHFLNKEDHFAHDVLCCISMGKLVNDEGRLKYPTELYLKSPEEMSAALGAWPEAIENTSRIAAMCDLTLDFSKRYAPVYRVPAEKLKEGSGFGVQGSGEDKALPDDERYLRQLCEEGLVWRYGTTEVDKSVRDRLEHELRIICMKQFCSYFLIVWDFCNYARDNGIPVGARGSGVGTMVGYLLGLCNVDPVKYNLLFERFMDPSRNEMPDIDIDICQDGRGRVIDYVRKKYGHVAQIITFGTLAAKAACKDVGRVLGVPLADIDKLTKLIPGLPGTKLKKSLDDVPELKEMYNANPQIKQVIDLALKLEGMNRNAGCHAAGVIIADQPLDTVVPLYTDKDDNILTQFEGPIAEKCGLLKMDFLGLRTLTTLTRAVDLELATRAQRGEERGQFRHPKPAVPHDEKNRIDIEAIDLRDPNVFDLFKRGETKGIFQFESGGMQDLLMKMQPDRVEDLIAANALYRPGPMELIPTYCNRKHGREAVPKVHPIMDAILAETYGIMVYQEQVMQIFNQLGGIELSNAYKLIKAISKKQADVIAKFQPDFMKGAMANGVSKDKAEEIFDFILKFGSYGFNKCVVADTVIVHADTGERTTVGELFRNRRAFTVHALGEDGKLAPRRVTDVMWNGRKRVYKLRTVQGKEITATRNHPFRTLDGWTNLENLRPGDRIAAPRRTVVDGGHSWPRHEIVTLAGLLSEGNTCHPSCLYFFGNDKALVDDFADAAGRFPETVARSYCRADGRRWEVCVSSGRGKRFAPSGRKWADVLAANESAGCATTAATASRRSGAFRWAERLGVVGRKATAKRVPGEVFELCDADLELFLGRLWAGDGFIANATQAVPYYATSSRQLATDVQALLLRLGIISGVHRKSFKYRGGTRPGYTVHLLGEGSVETFLGRVCPHCLGRHAAVAHLRAKVVAAAKGLTSKDTVPADVRRWVDQARRSAGLTWRELEAQSGVCVRELCRKAGTAPSKRGFRRDTIARLARFFESQRLRELAESDVFWDRVVSIEPAGVEDTYDLTVEVDHNFVADGLIVHNSHSTRYAIVAYQTAYMKVYHPVEYMSALLTFEMGSTEKVVEYIEDCRRMALPDGSVGIKVLPPDVNISDKDFTPVYVARESKGKRKREEPGKDGVIRFGLMAVRGVGEKAVECVIKERNERGEFPSLYDFCERVDLRAVTRATVDALIRCGAFSSLGARRAQLMNVLDRAVEMGQQSQNDKRSGQMSMFGQPDPSAVAAASPKMSAALPDVEEFQPAELLKFEKELLGFYITSHPLTEHQAAIDRYTTASTKEAMALSEGTEVMIGCMLNAVRSKVAKSGRSAGQKWAILVLEDLDGTIEAMCFAETYAAVTQKYPDAIKAEQIVFVKGKVDKKRETPSIMVTDILPIEAAVDRLTTALILKLDRARHTLEHIEAARGLIKANKGTLPVFVQTQVNLDAAEHTVTFKVSNELGARMSKTLVDDLRAKLGNDGVDMAGAGSKRKKRLEQQRLFKEEQLDVADAAAGPMAAVSDEQIAAAMDMEMSAAD